MNGSGETSLISRRISRVELVIAAAPSYLPEHGTLRSPADLAKHTWIMHRPLGAELPLTLHMGMRKASVSLQGRLSCNDGLITLKAAHQGLGMLAFPDFEAARSVHEGKLVRVLPAWLIGDAALKLVFLPQRYVLKRTRAFADFVADRFLHRRWRC